MGIAPLAAGWIRTRGNWGKWALTSPTTAGSPPIQGPNDPIGLKVEIYLGSVGWIDISPFVYYRDKIRISRGRPDETSQVQPQTAALTLNNRGGTFTPRLATGPYFKLIGRNTPIRISRTWNGERFYRYYGEVPAWPTTSDISGRDVYEQIQPSGMLRRLSQGNKPIGSAMRRAYAVSPPSTLIAYWPCEDGAQATSLASGLPAQSPMLVSGTPKLASNSDFICSDPLPLLSGSTWIAAVPSYTQPTPAFEVGNVVRFLLSVPASGAYDTAVIARVYTTGTVGFYHVRYGAANGGSLQMTAYDQLGNALFTSGYVAFGVNGLPARVSMELRTSGSNIFWSLSRTPINSGGPPDATGIWSAATVGKVTQVVINPDGQINDTAVGHVSVQSDYQNTVSDLQALTGWLGEPPCSGTNLVPQLNVVDTDRFSRLCREQNVPAVVRVSTAGYDTDQADSSGVVWSGVGPNPVNPSMGYQLTDTFANLIEEATSTGQGLLFEARDQISLVMRSRQSLYNQAPRLTLDHSQHQLSAPLNPLDDDQMTRNDITVTRNNGSSYQLVQTTGTLSIQPPPAGVGDYAAVYNISLGADSLLPDQAGWRLHLGTVDEPRYPTISLNLRHTSFTSNIDLMNAALTLDIGDRIVIVNPAPELPPDPISLIVQGYTETLGIYEHDMVLNCSPESPYEIAILEDPVLGHADTDGSTLAKDYPLGTETTISVATTGAAAGSPLWTTSAGDFPFDIAAGGERMTVTNITGAGSPQTFTVTRSVNGVVKGQTSGTDVRLWRPMILSL
ncbi:hypothetical protein ABIA35_006007 [Catenulispora sp. MAP12-49]|uniref:hypothetical protein n=1 Tax=Catenulispora sp. MAP12-49 TaxID=3156302 RepID=UPI003518A155